MMRSLYLIAISATFLLTFVRFTGGLDCYSCMYVDGISDKTTIGFIQQITRLPHDKSCKTGKKPDKKFLFSCHKPANDSIKSYCSKVNDQSIPISEKNIRVTVRGCFQTPQNLTETCAQKTLQNAVETGTSGTLYTALNNTYNSIIQLDPSLVNTSANFCACTKDKCNSSSHLKVSYFSIFILSIGSIIIAYPH